ncbi:MULTISPECIES: SRPBCC family protein [unclassified Meiothermus]|uniref:SRPBCC family protein n=1 Tax=unclassified Meiothermus TaxID=370471 RepID=UPI000D7C05D4|nr:MULTISPECIES: SRPBCC family protein [unclassified Meiothermus]PZA07990.1 polyketide cyclase [Meiothermus sp. Pnk-1]RYM35325.1 polyketide cyclase [Meiothermus sp. PNK-Is4]
MRFEEDLEIVIAAPVEVVWEAFQDFSSWPRWSTYLKEVKRHGEGWMFRARGMPPVDLVWTARAVEREAPRYVRFASIEGAEHDLVVEGSVWFEPTENGSRVRLHFEGQPHFKSPLMNRAADIYASMFGEPHKLLKVTLEEFKREVEARASSKATSSLA